MAEAEDLAEQLPPPLDYACPKHKKPSTVTQPTILGRNHLSEEPRLPPEDREYALLPERGFQTAPDLRPADEQWTVAAHQAASRAQSGGQERPMMQFFAKHVADGALAQDPATIKLVLSTFSRVLHRDAEVAETLAQRRALVASRPTTTHHAGTNGAQQRSTRPVVRQQSRPTHVGSADGAASNYRRLFLPLSDAETERDMNAWYANDKLPPSLPYTPLQADVSQIPAYTALAAQLVEARKRQRHTDEHLLGDLPRPLSANGGRPIPREYILQFRFPPRPSDRVCPNGTMCMFNLPAYAPHGYVGREFLLPGQEPTPTSATARLCFDCLLVEYRMQMACTPNYGTTPAEPINSFTVDPREYGRHCFMETMGGDDHATGIIGLVPIFSLNRREIIQIPAAVATTYGLDPERTHYYVAEVNEDFREASATPTPALPTNSSNRGPFSAGSYGL